MPFVSDLVFSSVILVKESLKALFIIFSTSFNCGLIDIFEFVLKVKLIFSMQILKGVQCPI